MVCNTQSMEGICFYSLRLCGIRVVYNSNIIHPLFFKPLTTWHTRINARTHMHACTHTNLEHTHIILCHIFYSVFFFIYGAHTIRHFIKDSNNCNNIIILCFGNSWGHIEILAVYQTFVITAYYLCILFFN